jgi:cytochrome c oxidase subunit I
MPRRVVTYSQFLQPLNVASSIFAFALGASMAFWLGMVIWNIVLKPIMVRSRNPWESLGVEWQLPTPIPVYNYEAIPTQWQLPYEYDAGTPAAVPEHALPAFAGGT